MRVKIYKMDDGGTEILVKRTRPNEDPSQLLRVGRGEFPTSALGQAIRAVRQGRFGEPWPADES